MNRQVVYSVYDEVEEYYTQHRKEFEKIESALEEDFLLPQNIVADTIKNYLVATINDGSNSYLLSPKKFKSSLFYGVVSIYFMVMSIFGKRVHTQNTSDVLFDNCFSYGFDENYQRLFKRLKGYKTAILLTFKSGKDKFSDTQEKIEGQGFYTKNNLFPAHAKYNHYYLAKSSRQIFMSMCKRFFLYFRLCNTLGLDILQLMFRMYRAIAIFEMDVACIKSKVLVSFDDNGYGALRYFIYKKNIDTIMILQNGYKQGYISNRMGDMYLYSDYYLGFGLKNIEIQKGMVSQNKLGVGSLKLYNSLLNIDRLQIQTNIYDILFVEQISALELVEYNTETYFKCIDFLCHFTKAYPQYTISYRARLDRKNLSMFGEKLNQDVSKIDAMLKDAGIFIDDDMEKNSYEEVLKSNIIVFYTSTLGFEALGMGKKVLNLNLDKIISGFSVENDLGTLVDDEYALFEEKLLYLLHNNTQEIKDYYNILRIAYMNTDEDIESLIFKLIEHNIKI
ncbi:hypothetical protein [Sulfurospirillum arsenophilum]|uniref:hypothetical protein n=1 Tax=Sulfurospirillum arsenophilum TaxID=56698 RepID=UPI0012EC0FA3|nr:hypothetical protein [Sulfurospirillum arsenophilum]